MLVLSQGLHKWYSGVNYEKDVCPNICIQVTSTNILILIIRRQ